MSEAELSTRPREPTAAAEISEHGQCFKTPRRSDEQLPGCRGNRLRLWSENIGLYIKLTLLNSTSVLFAELCKKIMHKICLFVMATGLGNSDEKRIAISAFCLFLTIEMPKYFEIGCYASMKMKLLEN